EVVKGTCQIGTLPAHAFKAGAAQRKENGWPIRGNGGRANSLPEEAHLAHNRMCHDAPHAQSAAIILCDVDGKMTGNDEIEGIRGLAIAIKHLRAFDVLSFEIGEEVRGLRARAKLTLQPRLEALRCGIGNNVRRRKQAVLAPR